MATVVSSARTASQGLTVRVGRRRVPVRGFFTKYILGVVAVRVIGALLPLVRAKRSRAVVLYGHRYAGNLQALELWLRENTGTPVYYVADEVDYFRSVRRDHRDVRVLLLQNPVHLVRIARARAVYTSHGPALLRSWLTRRRRPSFLELWHGVGFKRRNPDAVEVFKRYDAMCVSSPAFHKLHLDWGLAGSMLFTTGYARTDRVLAHSGSPAEVRADFDLPLDPALKVVLYAPTWRLREDTVVFPFDLSAAQFFDAMEDFARAHSCVVVVRPHLNTHLGRGGGDSERVVVRSSSDYPDTEHLLGAVDVLVTDWSSVFTDFLPLGRPIVFLDPEPTFTGWALTPADRCGAVASSQADLLDALSQAVASPGAYLETYQKQMAHTVELAWGDLADGHSAERCYRVLEEIERA